MFTINYRYLTEAQEYYKQKGYRVVDLKWVVPRRIGSITSPEPNSQASYSCYNTFVLVGSAEQRFIYNAINGHYQAGDALQAITPCFRPLDNDDYNYPYFMKLELFVYMGMPGMTEDTICRDAYQWMLHYINPHNLKFVHCDNEIDIIYTPLNLELGSYGKRSYEDHWWYYGTGKAEPRFSTAVNDSFQPGYHSSPIPKYFPNTLDKIYEELLECRDVTNSLLRQCELADILLAVEQYAVSQYGEAGWDAIRDMAKLTQRAFAADKR